MTIEVRSNIDTQRIVNDLLEEKRKAFELALVDATVEIISRTKSSRDASGSRFKTLGPQYLKYKVNKTGRGAADLTLTGKMLGAISSKVEIVKGALIGSIFFTSAEEAAKARGNSKLRKFFELSKSQITTILNSLRGN